MDANGGLQQNETKIMYFIITDLFSDPNPWLQIEKCSFISCQHQYLFYAETQLSLHTKWNIKKSKYLYPLLTIDKCCVQSSQCSCLEWKH